MTPALPTRRSAYLVFVADHRDVLRHQSPALAQRADRAERDEIAGRDDAVDVLPARQELGGRAFGRFEAEVDADIERGIESHVARIQRLEIALAALHRLRVAAAEEGDAAAAEAGEEERRAAAAEQLVRDARERAEA